MMGRLQVLCVMLRSVLVAMIVGATLLAAGVLAAPMSGHRAVELRSGSMTPAMPVGSLAILETVDPSEIRPGDVVTVVLDSGSLLTHRVRRAATLNGAPALVLHGDANAADVTEIVRLDQVTGRVVTVVPVVGYAAWWLTQPAGLAACVGLIGLLLVAIGRLVGPAGPGRWRHRRRWRTVHVGRLGSLAAGIDRGVAVGLDKPVMALLVTLVLAVASGAAVGSAAIFTSTANIVGNTLSTGTWVPDDYRSVATGHWDDAGTWQRFNGTDWVAATRPPSSIDGVVTVRNGHVVTATANVTADQVVVAAGGQLAVADGVVVSLADGSGSDIDIYGTVDVVGTFSVGSGADVAIESGGVLQDSGTVAGPGSITGKSGTIQVNSGGRTIMMPINLATGLTIAGGDDLVLGGAITGTSGSVIKTGTGTLILSGANTYTGATSINGGTVELGLANAIGSSSATTIASDAVLDLNGYSDTIGSLAGAGSVTSTAAGTVTLTAGGDNTSTAFSGVISNGTGQVALAKTGTGTLILSGANTYTGATSINGGTVVVQSNTALGSSATGTTVASGATLAVGISGLSIAEPVTSLIGTGVGGNGALRNLTGSTTGWTGAITLGAGGATIASDAGGLLTLNGITGAAQPLTVSGAGDTTIGGIIAGTGSLTKTGGGTLTLAGVNTYTGGTTVNAGTLSVAADTALGTVPGSATPGSLSLNGGTLATTGTWTLNANRGIALSGASTLSPATSLTYSGIIAGTGSLTKTGGGTLTLAGVNTYTGGTTVNAGTLAIADDSALGTPPAVPTPGQLTIGAATLSAGSASFALNGNRGITLTGAATFAGTATYTLTVNGVIAGSGSLIKTVANSFLALSPGNTYTGRTTITTGYVQITDGSALGTPPSSPVANQLAIATGAFLSTSGSFSINPNIGVTVTGTANVLTNAGTVHYDGVITGAGTLAKSGVGTLELAGANTYTGSTTIAAGGVVRIQSSGALGTGGSNTIASTGALEIDGSNLTVANSFTSVSGTGIGSAGAIRNLATSSNNALSGTITLVNTTTFAVDGGSLTIGTLGVNTRAFTLNTVGDTTFNNITGTTGTIAIASGFNGNTTINGNAINSTGTLTKSNGGSLYLNAAMVYTGATTLAGGTTYLGVDNAIGNSAVTVTSPGVLDLNGHADTVGSLAGTGSITSGVAGTVILAIGTKNTPTTFSGVLSNGAGVVALAKTGTGIQTLSGANTYTGGTTITGPTGGISVAADSGLGTAPGVATPGSISINAGGSLLTTGTWTLNANRGIATTGTSILSPAASTTLTYTGSIAGSGDIKMGGAGTLILGGSNTYTGATYLSAGTLSIASDLALGAVPGSPNPGEITWTASAILTTTGTMTINPNRGIALSAGTATFSPAASTTLTYTGSIAGTGALTKALTGVLELGGTNTYSGNTLVSAGILRIQNSSALGTGNVSFTSGAGVELQGSGLSIGNTVTALTGTGVALGGVIHNLANNNAWPGNITMTAASTVISDAGTLTLGGTISGAFAFTAGGAGDTAVTGNITTGAGTLIKSGAGNLVLSGNNTYTGLTTVNAGTIKAQSNTAFGGTATGITIVTGGTVAIDGNGLSIAEPISTFVGTGVSGLGALRNLGGSNAWTGTLTLTGAATIGSDSGTLTANAITSGAQNLTFVGAGNTTVSGVIGASTGQLIENASGGTLTLQAANTYTGVTTITAGTLNLTGSTAAGSAVTVAAGATLRGTGTINGALTVNGMLLPGAAPGTLTINGALSFGSTSTFYVEIGGTTAGALYSQVAANGSVTINASAKLTTAAILGYSPALTDAYTIINKSGAAAITGSFAPPNPIPGFLGTAYNGQISYVGFTGNDCTITVGP